MSAPEGIRILNREEVERLVDLDDLRAAVHTALIRAAAGTVRDAGILHLDLGADRGDLHVKGAWLEGSPVFAIKLAGAFPGAVATGAPLQQGVSLVLDARTGRLRAVIDDGGLLTDLRTAAAVAVVAERLGPACVPVLGLLGAGVQAHETLRALLRVRRPDEVRVWARTPERANAFAREHQDLHVVAVPSPAEAAAGASVVVTCTPSRAPLLGPEDVGAAALVVAVGADTPGKGELQPELLHAAAIVAADDVTHARHAGELQHAPEVAAEPLGTLLAASSGRRAGLTIVDLTGLGAQDAAAAELLLGALTSRVRSGSERS